MFLTAVLYMVGTYVSVRPELPFCRDELEQEHERMAALCGLRTRQCGVAHGTSLRIIRYLARLPPWILPHLPRRGLVHRRR